MAPADLIISLKRVYDDGAVLQVRVWRVPSPVRGSPHSFKYSLYYGKHGVRLIGYDNEIGKGDHCHHGDREEAYQFTTIEQLLADFEAEVEQLRGAG
jgi:hypothetical protein